MLIDSVVVRLDIQLQYCKMSRILEWQTRSPINSTCAMDYAHLHVFALPLCRCCTLKWEHNYRRKDAQFQDNKLDIYQCNSTIDIVTFQTLIVFININKYTCIQQNRKSLPFFIMTVSLSKHPQVHYVQFLHQSHAHQLHIRLQ